MPSAGHLYVEVPRPKYFSLRFGDVQWQAFIKSYFIEEEDNDGESWPL